MTQRAAFDSDEWSLLRSMPVLVAGAVAVVEPGGIIGALREATAVAAVTQTFLAAHPENELLTLLTQDQSIPAMPSPRQLMGEGAPHEQAANYTRNVMTRLHEALALLERKAAPEETAGYKQFLMQVASGVAKADKEGSFLGFGGKLVSENEQSLLDQLATRLGVPVPS
jgi:hypothetical protein